MTIREELQITWKHICAVALHPNNKRYEGVYCEWKTFDEFYSKNYKRYYRAKRKWKNYKKLTPEKYRGEKKANYEKRNICFVRKIKENGYTYENTVFTSVGDMMKYHRTSKKIYINDKLLGTRDVLNKLKKQGIEILNTGVINYRINKGTDPFKKNRLHKFEWKGKYLSLKEIAEKENIKYSLLRNKIFGDKMDIKTAVDYCINYKEPKYLFEGEMLFPTEIIKILSKRLNISEITLMSRFYKNNCDYTKIIYQKSENKYAPYPKKVKATKGDETLFFNSVTEACKKLNLNSSSARNYLNGKLNNTNQTKGYELVFI